MPWMKTLPEELATCFVIFLANNHVFTLAGEFLTQAKLSFSHYNIFFFYSNLPKIQ